MTLIFGQFLYYIKLIQSLQSLFRLRAVILILLLCKHDFHKAFDLASALMLYVSLLQNLEIVRFV